MPRLPPVTTRILSAATPEKPNEVGKRELVPGRAAVVAASGTLRLLHLPQERIHLGDGQGPVGADCRVAGHGGEKLVLARGERAAAAEFADFPQHIAREARDVARRA